MDLNTINKILGIFALLFVAVSVTIVICLLAGGLFHGGRLDLLLQCCVLLVCSVWLWLIIHTSIKNRRK